MALILALTFVLAVVAVLLGLRHATFWLMAMRPACDQAFNLVKLALGQESGPGAALNILVLAMAVTGAMFRPSALASPVVLAWGVFIVAAAASASLAPDPASSMRLLMTLGTYGAVLILADVLVRDRTSAALALGICVLSSAIPVIVAVIELMLTPSILAGDERLLGTFTHPNILAFYLVTMIGTVLFTLSTKLVDVPAGWRSWLYAWAGLLVVLLLATKTRSAWIAVALIMLAQGLMVDRRWLWLLPVSPLVLFVPGVGERFFDLFEGNTNDTFAQLNSLAWRQLLWADTFTWLADNPPGLLGHGLDHYVSYVPVFFQRGANPDGVGTHNALLQLYFEAGWLGLGTFVGAFAVALASLCLRWRTDPKATPIAIALVLGILVCSYSDNMLDYLQFQWSFWFFIGIICAAGRHVDAKIHTGDNAHRTAAQSVAASGVRPRQQGARSCPEAGRY